jgi:hypothetical protein
VTVPANFRDGSDGARRGHRCHERREGSDGELDGDGEDVSDDRAGGECVAVVGGHHRHVGERDGKVHEADSDDRRRRPQEAHEFGERLPSLRAAAH